MKHLAFNAVVNRLWGENRGEKCRVMSEFKGQADINVKIEDP